jgi:tetratricopeptide (TPR) repeat protein
MSKVFEKFHELIGEEKYDDAVQVFIECEKKPEPAAYDLVWKGFAILMASEDCPLSLEDVEAAYKRAIDEDDAYIDAYIELAYFYLNVMDNAKEAKPYFEKVLDMSRQNATESISGIAQCIGELSSEKKGLDYLKQNMKLDLIEERLERAEKDVRLLS